MMGSGGGLGDRAEMRAQLVGRGHVHHRRQQHQARRRPASRRRARYSMARSVVNSETPATSGTRPPTASTAGAQRGAFLFGTQRIVFADRAQQDRCRRRRPLTSAVTVLRYAGRSSDRSAANCVVAAGYTPCQRGLRQDPFSLLIVYDILSAMNQAEKSARTTAATRSIVIGGGILGLACAIELQRRGHRTLLFDPGMLPRAASWGNAGHIATEQVEPLASWSNLVALPGRLFSRGGAASFPLRDIGAWLPFGWRLVRASGPEPVRGRQARAEVAARGVACRRGAGSRLPRPASHCSRRMVTTSSGKRAAGARAGREHWARADIGTAALRDLDRGRTRADRAAGGLQTRGRPALQWHGPCA